MVRFPLVIPLAAAAFALGGCVTQGPFPSLAPRPEEGNVTFAEPVRPAPDVPPDAAVRAEVEAALAQARAGQRSFDSAYPAANAAVARAGAAGSERWMDAQEALSRLQATNSDTGAALIALDRLSTARADLPANEADRAFVEQAVAEIAAMIDAQQVRIRTLEQRLAD